MECKICRSPSYFLDKAKILSKYDVEYFKCSFCGFIQTEEPFWIEESYKVPIDIYDTGILQRNIELAQKTAVVIFNFFAPKGKFVDFAGGYGIFVRLMRDIGFDFYWTDKYSENKFAVGFKYNDEEKIELVTAFECFEHFKEPMVEIENLLKISKNIIFSTEILPEGSPKISEWWYYSPDTGQHISFYTLKSLKTIANYFKLNFYSDSRNYHLFTTKKVNKYFFMFLIKKYKKFGILNRVLKNMDSKTFTDMKKLLGRNIKNI